MTPPSIHDLHHQAQWEIEGTRRAVERYRDASLEADPMTLAPGKALIRGVVGPLIAAIEAAKVEATDALASPGGAPLWAWPIQVINAPQAAVITLNVAVRCVSGGTLSKSGGVAAGVTASAKNIAGAIKDQLEYERWSAKQTQANAEAARSKTLDHADLLKALRLRYPSLDRNVWRRWRAKLELAGLAEWDERAAVGLGSMLIKLLVTTAPDRFVIRERPTNGGVQYVLGCTEAVMVVMNDVRERAEVARPMLMPMLVRPNPWRYV